MGRRKKTNHIIHSLVNYVGVTATAKALDLSKSTINRWYTKEADQFSLGEKTLSKAQDLLSRVEDVKKRRERSFKEIPLFEDFEEAPPLEAYIYKDEGETFFIG